jgi:hypothetical protein
MGWLAHANLRSPSIIQYVSLPHGMMPIRCQASRTSLASDSEPDPLCGPHPGPAVVPQDAVGAWAPPQDPVVGSTNDRRVASYRTHPARHTGVTSNASPFGSTIIGTNFSRRPALSNSSSRRPPSRPFSVSTNSSHHSTPNARNAPQNDSVTFKAICLPYPVTLFLDIVFSAVGLQISCQVSKNSLMIDSEEPLPSNLKLSRQKLPNFYRRLDSHHLVIETKVTLTDSVILDELNLHFTAHLSDHNVRFAESPYRDNHAASGSLEYEKCAWVILELGKLSADQNSQLLKVARFTSWEITGNTLGTLMKKISTTMKNPIDNTPLLFIGMSHCLLSFHSNSIQHHNSVC